MKLRSWKPTRVDAVPILASSVLFALAFPPFPLFVPALLCLVPLAVAVARGADAGERAIGSARIGFWFGLVGYGLNLYWIASALAIYTKAAIIGYVAALLVLAPVVAAAMAALHVARRRTRLPMAVLLPVVWVASELALNYLADLAFPWLPLGLATARTPMLAQAADLSGVHGLSFLIALVNGLVADAQLVRSRRRVALSVAGVAAVMAFLAAYGSWRLRTTVTRVVAPIAVVQPNIPQDEKWQAEHMNQIMGILAQSTRETIARHDAQLILWPEASVPDYLIQRPDYRDTLQILATMGRIPILFGMLDAVRVGDGQYDMYNAAMLIDAHGMTESSPIYRKSYLVPIVERVPFVNPAWFRGLKYFGAFARGQNPALYELPFGKLGVLICYESIFPQRSRFYRRQGADLLVNITNDAWFGRSLAPYQHEAHLALRAIENRVGIVRDANTGISSNIDPLGRVHGETKLFVRDSRTYEALTTDVRTLYVRLGDWVGVLSLITTVFLILPWQRVRRPPSDVTR